MTAEELTAEELTAEPEQQFTPPPGGWTVDHLDAWPESHIRYELTDGALTVSPSPSSLHQIVMAALAVFLGQQAPEDVAVTGDVEVRFAHQLTRRPDVLAVRSENPRRHWFAPEEVLLAVEIESPGSHIEDRTTKPAIYAQFGIPHFWRIETEPHRITAYRLGPDGTYAREATGTRVTLGEPFPLDVDLAAILPAWARD